jgi:hypothetical protein
VLGELAGGMPGEGRLPDACHAVDCVDGYHGILGSLFGDPSAQFRHRSVPPGEMRDLTGQSAAQPFG